MHKEEVDLFVKALKSANEEFYYEAINKFRNLIKKFPNSELCDDSEFNIGLCYFNMMQFEKAIESFHKVIDSYPDSTISILEGGNEFGKTAAKSYFAIVNCYMAQGDIDSAFLTLKKLKNKEFNDSYILREDHKISFYEAAKQTLDLMKNS
jgi:TolA-binding protein